MNMHCLRVQYLYPRVIATLATVGLALGSGCAAPREGRQVIQTSGAPAAIGPYSQAVLNRGTLYVSGQIGIDPKTGQLAPGGIREQTAQAMDNLGAILTAAGMGFDDVLQAQVFLADMNDYTAMNEVYGARFKIPPARLTVQVTRLPRAAKVEILAIAARTGGPGP